MPGFSRAGNANRNGSGSGGTGDGKFISYSACSSPLSQRRGGDQRRGSEKGSKKKLTMMDLKTFVETKLLSKSEKMLEKIGAMTNCDGNVSFTNWFQKYILDEIVVHI